MNDLFNTNILEKNLNQNTKHKNAESQIQAIQIALASPEEILSWSKGEVTKAETINYKSLKPEKFGLFDEIIFGPTKDYECSCGKYKKLKFRGKKCERCKVDITEAIVRRERMGHIELACPVAHIWMLKELPLPSKISLVLGMTYKSVEEIIYFVNFIVLHPGYKMINDEFLFKEKEVISISDNKNSSISRSKLRRLLRFIYEEIEANHPQGVNSLEYHQGLTYYQALSNSNLPFSIHDVFEYIREHTGLKVGIGAEAIFELLKSVNLDLLEEELLQTLNKQETINYSDIKVKKTLRRLSVIRWLKSSGNKPEWMILKVIPVIPPDLRPIIQLDGGRFTTSDINTFYRRIIIRNDRLKRILKLNAAPVIANNEKRMLQEAVDSLIDNNSRKKPLVSKDKHPLKSLTEHLKGKQGLMRQNLLGKRVDYSGRSVIVVGPELKMYQVGIPILMILKLFKPFIIHELIKSKDEFGNDITPIATSIRYAEKMIIKQENDIWPIVKKVVKERPVILNRAPTLHCLGIQAFEVKLTEGKAIRLHPLVTTAFNADFDGDQMAVHIPISNEAVHEARAILLAPHHILSPKDGKSIITPTQDMILGIYYLTMVNKDAIGTGLLFSTIDEAIHVYNLNKVHLHSVVAISTDAFKQKKFTKKGILITTIGKLILNNALPDDYIYINYVNKDSNDDVVEMGSSYKDAIASFVKTNAFTKNDLSKIIENLHSNYSPKVLPIYLDKIKDLGFEYSTKSCTTISAFDVPKFSEKYEMFKKADEYVIQQKEYFKKGYLTEEERYKNVIAIWNGVKDNVSTYIKNMMSQSEFENNSIVIMAKSGARGNISNFTQLSGMRGLMGKSYNYDQKSKTTGVIHDVIELPIKHSFIEGLTVSEYFNSSYGARKGMTDTAMKTSKSGYMTRKLVDATQEIIVKSIDCGTKKGIKVSQITDTRLLVPIETLQLRIIDRFSNEDIYDLKTKELIVKRLDIITPEIAEKIVANGYKSVEIRSIFCCEQQQGICQKCFGHDLTTKQPIEIGVAIGVIAAQSVGEPGTQLTMRTFHSGGVASENNVSQGFERLKQLFDMISPKKWEKAVISQIQGQVKSITNDNKNKIIIVKNEIDTCEYIVDINSTIRVKVGDNINYGDKIIEGSIDIKELLDVAGIHQVRQYMIKEIQKLYYLQGIEISDRYIEIIICQLTNKLKILTPNDSKWSIHEIVDQNTFKKETTKLLMENKIPPTAINLVFGLEDAAAKTNSFLASASFQDTKKILTDAAIKGEVDYLNSLKENVIMGNLIPVGTGLKTSEEVIQMGEKIGKFDY